MTDQDDRARPLATENGLCFEVLKVRIGPDGQISDMTTARCAGAVPKALKAADHAALVRVDLATFTVEIEPSNATARQLGDAIKRAGYSPVVV